MATTTYKDANGVRWTIVEAEYGYALLGHVHPDEERVYARPEDFSARMSSGVIEPIQTPSPPTGEQQRVLMTELRGKIDAYARDHKNEVQLVVKASSADGPSVPWWLVGAGLYLLMKRR